MTFSLKRVQAIFIKDWKDLAKNSYIIFTLAIPLFFAAWLGRQGVDDASFHLLPITLSLVISGCFVQAAMVAEEKEKNTLRGLLLSPASTTEILVGKSALTAVLTILIIIFSVFLAEINIVNLPLYSLLILLNLLIFIAIGTILGLVSRTVMETSIVGMPVMLIFGMGPMFQAMISHETILKIMSYLPSEQLSAVWLQMNDGSNQTGIVENLLILFAWCIVTFGITYIVYRRNRFDR